MVAALCPTCSLCCNGVLHRWTRVFPGEEALLERLGLEKVVRDGTPCFDQPCPRLAEPLCTVYADRPRTCRTYHCALLQKVEAGTVDVAAAQRDIAAARAAIDRIRAALSLPAGATPWPAVTALLEALAAAPDPIAARRKHAKLLADVATLELLARARFLPPQPP